MKELAQIRTAVVNALQEAGLAALEAFPRGEMKRYQGAVAAVAVGTAAGGALGFCNYLGESWDEASGTVRELYGKQLEGEIEVDVRAESAAACEKGCETVSEVLLEGLPAGIRPGELRWEALCWEKHTGMFLRKGHLQCRAMFIAREKEDGEVFLDFILKGVMN